MNKETNLQKGQALLFIIVAMTVALAVGIAVSTRTLSSVRRTSSTDSSARVFAAAEGGIEWFLQQPVQVLENLSDGNNADDDPRGNDCPTGSAQFENDSCMIDYPASADDTIDSRAIVKIQAFRVNFDDVVDGHYWFNIEPGSVKEVRLMDETGTYYRAGLEVCWNSLDSANSSGIYYIMYDANGVVEKNIISPNAPVGTYEVDGDVSANSGSRLDYTNCHTLNINQDTVGIRFKSLYVPSKIGVFPADIALFPLQGYEIISTGELTTGENIKTTRKVSVYRSYPYMPAIFDYAVYSENTLGTQD